MRALLGLAVALVLLVVVCSAALRLAASGVGCTPWPGCYAQAQAAAPLPDEAVPEWQHAVRLTHRISATAAGLLFVFIVAFGFGAWSLSQRVAGTALLVLAVALALIGRITPSPSAAVVLANLLGGHLLLAALAWLLTPAPRSPATAAPSARWIGWPLCAGVLLLLASGGLVSALAAAAASGHGVLLLHTSLGVLALLALALAAWQLRRRAPAATIAALSTLLAVAVAVLGLPPLQRALGLPAAAAHSVLAGLTLAGCVALWRSSRR